MNARGQENLAYFQNPNVRAFAYMLSMAEGTNAARNGHNYYTLVGGAKINSLSAHPNILVSRVNSTAAGLYQFLYRTWSALASKLNLKDFSEDSQNAAFVELLREKNALEPLLSGDFDTAVYRARKVWASLPGAGYGQKEFSLNQVREWFQAGLSSPVGIQGAVGDGSLAPVAALVGVLLFVLILN